MILQKIKILKERLKKTGIDSDYTNTSTNPNFNVDLYKELNKLYDEYLLQLHSNKKLSAKTQLTFDMKQYIALDLKENTSEDAIAYRNAIKEFFIMKIKENDYGLLDTVLLSRKKYITAIFNDSNSLRLLNNYLTECIIKIQELEEKLNRKEITKLEKELLMRMLSNPIFNKKYPNLVLDLTQEILRKKDLSKVETLFLSKEVAKWKIQKRNLPYIKPYLIEEDEKGEYPTYNGCYKVNLLYLNYPRLKGTAQDVLWTTLHEYEHHLQHMERIHNVLTLNSLSITTTSILKNLSDKDFDEYHSNYVFKNSEMYANARAKIERILFNIEKLGIRRQTKKTYETEELKKHKISMRRQAYRHSMVYGYQEDRDSNDYTIGEYNVTQLEQIIQRNNKLLTKYPLLLSFYNQSENRLKNLVELSEEYVEQPVDGREALATLVDHQILNGDLNNINFNEMNTEEITRVLLLLSRHLRQITTRLYNYIGNYDVFELKSKQKMARDNNLNEMIQILKSEISFFRNNLEKITSLTDDWYYYSSEKTLNEELFGKHDDPSKHYNLSAISSLGIQNSNPIIYIERFATGNIVEIMKRYNQKYKHLSIEHQENLEEVFRRLEEEIEQTSTKGHSI